MVGSGQPYVLALCMLTTKVSEQEKVKLTLLLKELLQKINLKLEQHEQLAKLVVVAEEWSVTNGFFTPTLKIKRKSIDNYYSSYYSQWLNSPEVVLFL